MYTTFWGHFPNGVVVSWLMILMTHSKVSAIRSIDPQTVIIDECAGYPHAPAPGKMASSSGCSANRFTCEGFLPLLKKHCGCVSGGYFKISQPASQPPKSASQPASQPNQPASQIRQLGSQISQPASQPNQPNQPWRLFVDALAA